MLGSQVSPARPEVSVVKPGLNLTIENSIRTAQKQWVCFEKTDRVMLFGEVVLISVYSVDHTKHTHTHTHTRW